MEQTYQAPVQLMQQQLKRKYLYLRKVFQSLDERFVSSDRLIIVQNLQNHCFGNLIPLVHSLQIGKQNAPELQMFISSALSV